jgi:predicted nucleotidyltransferase
MERDQVIERLRQAEARLRASGVVHAALFGSVARGDTHEKSDIDIFVELDPSRIITMFDYASLKDEVAGLFPVPVDVVDREALKPRIRPRALADAIYAF